MSCLFTRIGHGRPKLQLIPVASQFMKVANPHSVARSVDRVD